MDLAEIREGEINVKVLRSGRKALVIKQGSDIKVFDDLCPHMGGDMTTATYCAAEGTLACSWRELHCSVPTTAASRQPQRAPLLRRAAGKPSDYRPEITPRFRLRVLPFQIKGSTLYFEGAGFEGAGFEGAGFKGDGFKVMDSKAATNREVRSR